MADIRPVCLHVDRRAPETTCGVAAGRIRTQQLFLAPSPSTPLTIPLTPRPSLAPGAPVSSCTPAAAADADVLSPKSASASSRSYLLLIRLDAHYLGFSAVPAHEQPASSRRVARCRRLCGTATIAAAASADFRHDVPDTQALTSEPSGAQASLGCVHAACSTRSWRACS